MSLLANNRPGGGCVKRVIGGGFEFCWIEENDRLGGGGGGEGGCDVKKKRREKGRRGQREVTCERGGMEGRLRER